MNNLNDFMCKCSPEGLSECAEIYEWAIKDLECEDDPTYFITNLTYGLEWGLPDNRKGWVTGLYADQWAGVSAEVFEGETKYTASVQCDRVEHGLARIWKWAKTGL